MDNSVFILSGIRTATGSLNGCFEDTPARILGAVVIQEAIVKANVTKADIDQVIMGQVLTAGQGENTARQSSTGCDLVVPATTINMRCGSGLKAVELGYWAVISGSANVVVCGGQENMSMAQHTAQLKTQKRENVELKDTIICDGLTDCSEKMHIGESAELLAQKYKVTRDRQDSYAALSHNRAEIAILSGFFKAEIVGIHVKKTQKVILEDELPQFGTTVEKLSELKPCFIQKNSTSPGSVTIGNSAGMSDGAAAVVLCSANFLWKRQLFPLAKILGFAHSLGNSFDKDLAPADAILNLLEHVGWSKDQVHLYEINESFAVQADLIQEHLGLDKDTVNVSGGAIALGHPIGATGARILVTLIHNLQRLELSKGIAAICTGGGMGLAIAIEVMYCGSSRTQKRKK